MPGPEFCPAIAYVDPELARYIAGPMYDQVQLPQGVRMNRSIGPPCVDRQAMAAEVAESFAQLADACEGVCKGSIGCLVLEQSVQLRMRDELGRVKRQPDYM